MAKSTTVLSAELAEAIDAARVLVGPNGAEIALDWCIARRPACFMDAYDFAVALAELTQRDLWWRVVDAFETRRIAACRASKAVA